MVSADSVPDWGQVAVMRLPRPSLERVGPGGKRRRRLSARAMSPFLPVSFGIAAVPTVTS